MRIGIDARLYEERSGVGQYTRCILDSLQPLWGDDEIVLFGSAIVLKKYAQYNVRIHEVHGHPYTLSGQFSLLKALHTSRCDRIYFTHFTVPLGVTTPFVVTIHDLIMTHVSSRDTSTRSLPFFLLKRLFYTLTMRYALSRSTRIITNSDAVRRDIQDTYGVDSSKIHVIYPGVCHVEGSSALPLILENKKYFLCVGSLYPHKNVDIVRRVMKYFPSVYLALTGKEDAFSNRFSSHDNEHILMLGYVSPEELVSCYRHALVVIHPSLMEGFGFPALEALHEGARVVVSDIPVHHEILGDTVEYFNPHSVASLHEVLRPCVDNEPHISYKKELPREYTFESTAQNVWKVVKG